MYAYDDVFFSYIDAGARASARVVIPLLAALGPKSVLDLGCGRGAWLRVWSEFGFDDVLGIDGPYVRAADLCIPSGQFRSHDLAEPLHLGRRFDIATCFEVGEHLPASASATLVDSLCRHAPLVAFSAAVPGQGGERHVNEQPYEFWRDLFAARGYRLLDCLRPRLAHSRGVEPWYRYNSFLFASEDGARALPPDVINAAVPEHACIPDVSPIAFRIRKAALRRLSPSQVSALAVLKHRLSLGRSAS